VRKRVVQFGFDLQSKPAPQPQESAGTLDGKETGPRRMLPRRPGDLTSQCIGARCRSIVAKPYTKHRAQGAAHQRRCCGIQPTDPGCWPTHIGRSSAAPVNVQILECSDRRQMA
jgi:hypothetical protein